MTREQMRARVIADWRGLPEVPFSRDTVKPVADVLGKLLVKLGLADRVRSEEINAAWRELVGDFIAQHSAPQGLAQGILTVRVLQPTLHYELDRVFKPQLLAKLRARFGPSVIRELRFRVG